ncbi:MAG: DUF1501 domain-containing protein, partial [Phycisphaeraceae bacterium]|nr:DUF1501 domain-containing protein [Phycisphaeraceae bacterium]
GPATGQRAGVDEDRVLVVVQLSGGNDGLNTVIPKGQARYYDDRPRLAIPENEIVAIPGADDLGLHPALRPIAEMVAAGSATIVPGVGYPNPNRSHFASMDIWHTGDTRGSRGRGWIGSALDQVAADNPTGCIAIGDQAPLATRGRRSRAVTFSQPNMFQWLGHRIDPRLRNVHQQMIGPAVPPAPGGDDAVAFVQRVAANGLLTSQQVRKAVARQPETDFPRNPLANQLRMVAAMIRDELPTRVFYTALGGFDTHANQLFPHQQRLGQFAEAVSGFYRELKATGHDQRVLTLAFSEFGRRVAQNASGGTDHGTAGPSFLFGPMVRPGVYGDYPSLENLDQGDLKHNIDFRSVYTTVLDDWLGANAAAVLGRAWRPVRVIG